MFNTNILKDSNQILDIILSCNKDFITPNLQQSTFQDTLQKITKHSTFIVATTGDENVGYIAFYANDNTTHTAYITLFATNPRFQKQGVGHLLINECEKYALNNNMNTIKLEVKKHNTNAIRFYTHHGYLYLCDKNEISMYMHKKIARGDNVE